MSDSDGERAGPSSSAVFQDGYVSPISAADMLNRSLRRTPRRTTTPSRKLFPDDIDIIAPGMTPTSKSRPKRKSTLASRTPRRSSTRVASSSMRQQPSQTPLNDVFDDGRRVSRKLLSDNEFATPRATPGNRSLLRRDDSITRGKQKARESESDNSTSLVVNQFGGWGSGREESPMELLRRLVRAPGRLQSPTKSEGDTVQSISQRLESSETSISLKPGLTAPGDEMPLSTSRPSGSSNRITASRVSVANTSTAASEAGQGKRAARQSQYANVFSDILGQDTGGNLSMDQTSGKRSDFPSLEEDDSRDRDDVVADDTVTLDEMADTTAAASTKRFEDIETSIESTRSRLFNDEEDEQQDSRGEAEEEEEEVEPNKSDVFRTRNRLAQNSGAQELPEEQDSTNVYDYDDDQELPPFQEGKEMEYQDVSEEQMLESANDATESSDGEEEEIFDQSKELQHARLALLRKRRTKKKAKRYSSISGNFVPCLPSGTIKGLFASSVMPKTGLGVAQPSKGKIVVEKGAAEAVEDLTHHFFAQFMQSLVSQADQKSQSSISERDIIALMKSQGQVCARSSLSFLARKHLPKELSDLVTSTTALSESASARKPKGNRKAKAIAIVEDDRIVEEEDDESDV